MSVLETGVTSTSSSTTTKQLSGVRWQFEQTSDSGDESLTSPGDDYLYAVSGSDNFSISQASADSPLVVYSSDDTAGDEGSATATGSDAYNVAEVGDTEYGTVTQSSDSYTVNDYYYLNRPDMKTIAAARSSRGPTKDSRTTA